MCAFKIVVYNLFFVADNNFPQKIISTLSGKQRNACVDLANNAVQTVYVVSTFQASKFLLVQSSRMRLLFNQFPVVPFVSTIDFRWITLANYRSLIFAAFQSVTNAAIKIILALKCQIQYLQASWNTTSLPEREKINSHVLATLFLSLNRDI